MANLYQRRLAARRQAEQVRLPVIIRVPNKEVLMKASVSPTLPHADLEPAPVSGTSRIELIHGPAMMARRGLRHNTQPVTELIFRLADGRRRLVWIKSPPDVEEHPVVYAEFNPSSLSGEDNARDAVKVEFDSL